jgi:hypothetical protein
LTDLPPYHLYESLSDGIDSILIVTQIYHLIIEKVTVREGMLILILSQLTQLVSLKIHSLLTEELPDQLAKGILDISDISKITKICLEEVHDVEEVHSLMSLSYGLNYLQINSLHDVDIELLIREIFMRTNEGCNEDLRFLCIRIPTADDQLIEKLQETIDGKRWLVDYTIERIVDNIYFRWR